jgi:hypothetical protein
MSRRDPAHSPRLSELDMTIEDLPLFACRTPGIAYHRHVPILGKIISAQSMGRTFLANDFSEIFEFGGTLAGACSARAEG